MARPFSNDFRRRMVDTVRSGVSCRKTSELFQVSVSCVIKLMQRVEATGDVSPARFGGFKTSPLVAHEDDLRAWVSQTPEITIAELQSRLEEKGTRSSHAAIARYLVKLGLTRKKRQRLLPSVRVTMSPKPARNGSLGRAN